MSADIIQEIVSSTIIKSQSCQSLKLSSNDWIIPSSNTISCIYFYDIQQWSLYAKQSNHVFIHIEQLILSLQKLLEYYPLLIGTLTLFDSDNKVSIEYDDNKGGILFVSTTVNIPLSQLPIIGENYTDTQVIPDCLQLTNPGNSDSLFHIRHTRFSCGSVALGITLNHQVADAHSYFQLVQDWTQLYRNLDYQPDVFHQRSLLQPTLEEIHQLKISNPDFNHRKSLSFKEESFSSSQQTEQTVIKRFRFSASELNRMKSDALIHLPSNISYLSTLEVLTAHLYRHVMLARHRTTRSTITRLYISTNIRPRLTHHPIPRTYFGNAIMLSYSEMHMSELINENRLGLLASRVHQAIEENTDTDIRTTLAWIVCQRDKTKIAPTWNLESTDFTISAWNKMGMYSNSDFELGFCPCRILLPQDMKFSGAAILFSTEQHDESIDVFLGLNVNDMQQLEENADFRKYCQE